MRRVLPALLLAAALGAGVEVAAAETSPGGDLEYLLDRIRAEPRAAAGFAALAGWLFRAGDVGRARAAAAEAARLEPDDASHLRLLGYLAAADGAEAEALAALRQAAAVEPSAAVSLADFHLARAWAGYQDALRRGGPEPALLLRLREIAAAQEIAPEIKALVRGGWPEELRGAPERVPPLVLGEAVDTAVVVEKSTQTLRLYGRGEAGVTLLKTYPCTTGQAEGAKQERGDLRTPDGVYFVTDLLPGHRLPSEYGALALPLDYPNPFDRRAGRSGHGIWLHGSDRLGSPFTPRDTRGCVILRNDDLLELAAWIEPGLTPILIAERVPDRPLAEWQVEWRRLLRDEGEAEPAAVVAGPEYTVLLRPGKAALRRVYRALDDPRAPLEAPLAAEANAAEWPEKLRLVKPDLVATLRSVAVLDGGSRVLLETTAPVRARLFRPEAAGRLYVDLAGVLSGALPEVIQGSGAVARVRVSTVALEPPLTRIVIELASEVVARIEVDGTRIALDLGDRQAVAAAPAARAARR